MYLHTSWHSNKKDAGSSKCMSAIPGHHLLPFIGKYVCRPPAWCIIYWSVWSSKQKPASLSHSHVESFRTNVIPEPKSGVSLLKNVGVRYGETGGSKASHNSAASWEEQRWKSSSPLCKEAGDGKVRTRGHPGTCWHFLLCVSTYQWRSIQSTSISIKGP